MRAADEDRAEAGIVLLPLVLLAVYGLGLLALGIWRVAESSMAVTDAARSGARAYVEAPAEAGRDPASSAAVVAARSAATAAGIDAVSVSIDTAARERCAVVEVTVAAEVPALLLPWVGEVSSATVSSTHRQVVDPLRSGLQGEASCLDR